MPTLQQLRYLVSIADTLNFSRAAELCNVAQPTLSMQLKALEERLGARLVERTRARVFLTPTGHEIARRARGVLAEIDDIREVGRRDDPAATQARLQLGVVQTVGAYVLSVAMPALRARFPEMRIWVRDETPEALVRQLLDGSQDAILLPEALQRNGLICAPLIVEPLQVVLPAEHPLARKAQIDPQDLRGESILTMERGHRLHGQIVALCEAVGAEHVSDYEGATLDTLRQMVATGMGISLLPALYVRSEVMREQLVTARPMSSGAPFRQISLIWRRNAPREATYAALAACLRGCLRPWDAAMEAGAAPVAGGEGAI